jgi:hypothetical protein
MTREQAQEQLNGMTLEDCIEMWNEYATDHYCRYIEMHPMSDEEWWDVLARELGTWNLTQAMLLAGEHFNTSDKYFFYEEFNGHLISFSTSQELLEEVGEDFFVELLMN